jgi:hypothetical protein
MIKLLTILFLFVSSTTFAQYEPVYITGNDTTFLKCGTDSIFDKSGENYVFKLRIPARANTLLGYVSAFYGVLLSKANAVHSHAIDDVTSLQTSLNGKAATSHAHAVGDVTNLQTLLDAKAASVHAHTIADVSGLQSSLDAKAASDHTHSYNNLTDLPAGAVNAPVKLAQDVINNNAVANTLQDISNLAFNVTTGNTYEFEFVIFFSSAATTTGARFGINGPATTFLNYRTEWGSGANARTFHESLTAYNLPANASTTSAATSGNMAVIKGSITPSANGTVIARFASEISNSAVTAKAGSYVKYNTY